MTQSNPFLSVEQYMELLASSDVRYEYWDGEAVARAGASLRHNLITMNIGGATVATIARQGLHGCPQRSTGEGRKFSALPVSGCRDSLQTGSAGKKPGGHGA